MKTKKETSLHKRYGAKLLSHIVIGIISMIVQMIIPRALGPAQYGVLTFLTETFNRLTGFMELSSSSCFYTKLSQRPKEFGLVSFYAYFIMLVCILFFAFLAVVSFTGVYSLIWPGQKLFYIYFAAVMAILLWGKKILQSVLDAYALTVSSEIVQILQSIMVLGIVASLFYFNKLTLTCIFTYNCIVTFLLGAVFILIVIKNGFWRNASFKLESLRIRKYISEFYHYSHPLFIGSLVCLLSNFFDPWILQYFAGSTQQGYFGLTVKIGTICFIFTSAMTPLIIREFSIAHYEQDMDKMKNIFDKSIPIFFVFTSFIACFMAVHSKEIVLFFGGKGYSQAFWPMTIMAFYPIYQTFCQLTSSVYFATGKTKKYRNIVIFFSLTGLPLTYFFLSPYFLNLGSFGLALKTLIMAVASGNAMIFFSRKLLDVKMSKLFVIQVSTIAVMIAFACFSRKLSESFIADDMSVLLFFVSGFLYSAFIVLICFFSPVCFGMKKEDIGSFLSFIRQQLKKLRSYGKKDYFVQ